jgi:hypothetical protein
MRLGIVVALLLTAASAVAGPRYVYSRGGSHPHIISAGKLDVPKIRSLQRQFGGDFLWTRINGREYVIRDRATLDEIQKLYAPLDAFSHDYEALQRRLRPVERREEELDNEMDESDYDDDSALRHEYREVQRQLRVLEAEENRLDRQQEEVEERVENELAKVIDRAIARGLAERL